jgi:hypothetical protein
VSRVRENRTPESMQRRQQSGASRACTRRTLLGPPADATATAIVDLQAGSGRNRPRGPGAGQRLGASLAGSDLAAELGERALLALVEGAEGARDASAWAGKRLDEVAAGDREIDDYDAAVTGRAPAQQEPERLERGRDLVAFAFDQPSRRRSVFSSSEPPAVVSTTSAEKPAADTPSRSS